MDKFKKIVKEWLPYVVILILVLVIKINVASLIRVNGKSMNNTLKDGDIMVLDIIGYKTSKLERFDIAVVDNGKDYLIKRVIGLPNEEIEYKDNKLYINGELTEDKFDYLTEDYSVQVGKDEYFCLGDNRQNSADSRIFGCFNKKEIKASKKGD